MCVWHLVTFCCRNSNSWYYMAVLTVLVAGWYIGGYYWPNTVVFPKLD